MSSESESSSDQGIFISEGSGSDNNANLFGDITGLIGGEGTSNDENELSDNTEPGTSEQPENEPGSESPLPSPRSEERESRKRSPSSRREKERRRRSRSRTRSPSIEKRESRKRTPSPRPEERESRKRSPSSRREKERRRRSPSRSGSRSPSPQPEKKGSRKYKSVRERAAEKTGKNIPKNNYGITYLNEFVEGDAKDNAKFYDAIGASKSVRYATSNAKSATALYSSKPGDYKSKVNGWNSDWLGRVLNGIRQGLNESTGLHFTNCQVRYSDGRKNQINWVLDRGPEAIVFICPENIMIKIYDVEGSKGAKKKADWNWYTPTFGPYITAAGKETENSVVFSGSVVVIKNPNKKYKLKCHIMGGDVRFAALEFN